MLYAGVLTALQLSLIHIYPAARPMPMPKIVEGIPSTARLSPADRELILNTWIDVYKRQALHSGGIAAEHYGNVLAGYWGVGIEFARIIPHHDFV